MGQRLVIRVYDDVEKEPVASVYYHWSGYTESALTEAKRLITNYKKVKEEHPEYCVHQALYSAISKPTIGFMDEIVSGGFSASANMDEEYSVCDNIRKWFDVSDKLPNQLTPTNRPKVDRNCGLIAFGERNRQNLEDWYECDISIDITDETINMDGSYMLIPYTDDMEEMAEILDGYYDIDEYTDADDQTREQILKKAFENLPEANFQGWKTLEEVDELINHMQHNYVSRYDNFIQECIY